MAVCGYCALHVIQISKLKPMMEKYHVNAYLAGHDHCAEHINEGGANSVDYHGTCMCLCAVYKCCAVLCCALKDVVYICAILCCVVLCCAVLCCVLEQLSCVIESGVKFRCQCKL